MFSLCNSLFCLILLSHAIFSNSEIIKLRPNNFVTLRGPIDGTSASIIVDKLISLQANEIYLYLDSPGGSVMAGLQIIQAIESLQQIGIKVNTIANNIASMAFIIHQSGTKRYVRPWSILMQHQMSYGNDGQFYNIKSHEKLMDNLYQQLLLKQAIRANITLNQFDELTKHDIWLLGAESINHNFADEVANVICDFEPEVIEENIKIMSFDIIVSYSSCPLSNKPLNIEINQNVTSEERSQIISNINLDIFNSKLI